MKFLRPKKDKKAKHFFMQDIVRRTIDNHPILKENLPIIEIHFDRMKELFREHYRAIFGVLTLIVSLSILSAFSLGHASVTNFYPSSCLGGWEHPENAQGEPSLFEVSKIEDFNISNSARLDKSSGSVFCGSFKGEILDNTQPTNFHLSFSWSVDDGSIIHNEVKPFDNVSNTDQQNIDSNSTDVNNSSTTTDTNNNSNVNLIEVKPETTTPDSTESTHPQQGGEEIPKTVPEAPTPTPAPAENPVQAFLNNIFATPVFAQENSDPVPAPVPEQSVPAPAPEVISEPVVSTSTTEEIKTVQDTVTTNELNSDKINQDAFAEVEYTLDGTDWKTLGTVSRSQWKNTSFDIPLDAWANLDNLQVSIKTLPTYDTPAVIYLDAMKMSIEYQDIKEILNRPTVELKDSSSVISNPQQDFNSSENVNFTINTPNLDINGIKDLVNNGTAEVVDDKTGVLTDTPVVDTTTSDNTINSVKDILKPTTDSLNTALPDNLQNSQIIVLPDIPKIEKDKTINTTEINPTDTPVSFLDFLKTKKALADVPDITAKVLDLSGNDTDINTRVINVNINGIDKQQVQIIKGREFKPGKYTLKVTVNTPQAIIVSQQDFTWGVLSINTNKSIFEIGDDAYLQMGVLNDGGHTICDADLNLVITSPSGVINNFSTNNNSIVREKQCGPDNVISVPDYYAHFNIPSETGTYNMRLTANTVNGTKTITDTFDVVQNSNFVVERVGPSRIYPYDTPYPMNIKVTAKNNWQGIISEYVPESFIISQIENGQNYISVNTVEDPSDPTLQVKKISWNVSLVANQEIDLGYIFNAPPVSPEFYTLGKIQLNNNGNISFEEARNWQIASDAACTMTAGTWDGVAGASGGGTAVWSNCTGGGTNRPAVGDTITIQTGITLTITGSGTVAGITLNSATTANGLIINNGATLTDTGALTFSANAAANAETVTLGSAAGGAGNLTVASIGTSANTSTGATQVTCFASATQTGTLTVTGTAVNSVLLNGSAVASSKGGTIDLSAGGCNMTMSGTGGGITYNLPATDVGTPTVKMAAGTISLNTGGITFTSAAAQAGKCIFNMSTTGGTVSLNGTTLPVVGNCGAYTFSSQTNLTSSGTSAINYATAVATWGTLNITSGTLTLPAVAETFLGAATLAGTLQFGAAAATFSSTVEINSGGKIQCPAAASCTGAKTFTGNITVSGTGSLDLTTSSTAATVSIGGTAYTNNGGVFNTYTGGTTITGTGALSFAGGSSMKWGSLSTSTMTIPTNRALSNDMTSGTLTIGAVTFATAPANAISLSLSNGTTTTVIGAITYAVGASAQSESILMNGTANLNAGSISMPVISNAGSALLTCVASCSGTLAVTGAVSIVGNATAAQTGASTVAMDTANMTVGGLLSIAGGAVTAATLSQSTGNLTLSAGITFSGTSANARLTTTGANTISFAGNWTNTVTPTLTINAGTTLKTTGTATLCITVPMVWPGKLWVSAGVTTLALAETITGTTEVTSTLQNASAAGAVKFFGTLTLDSGATFNMSVVTAATPEYRGGIVVNSGAVAFTSGSTSLFSTNSQSISGTGTIDLTLGTTTINANIILTNNYTGGNVNIAALTVTGGILTADSGLSLATGSRTATTTTLTVGANQSAGAFSDTITLNGTATLTIGTTLTMTIPTTIVAGAKEGIIAASGASGTVSVGGLTTINGGATGTQFCGIDLSAGTNALTTAAVTLTGGATGTASLIMGTGALTINGAVTFGVAGNITRSVITTGASIITLNNSALGANGTLSVASATLNTSGTTALNGAYTFPNLNVLSGTTTMGGVAISITGQTSISGILNTSSATGTKTFGSNTTNGLVTVNSGGTFNFSAFGTPLTFYGGITMASGATAFTMLTTNVVTFGSGLGNAQTISGGVNMTFGAVTIGNSEILTNASTATVTMQSLSILSPGSIANGLSLSNLSTTTVTGAIAMTGNGGGLQNETITMNGNANLNAGSMSIAASTTAVDSSVVCNGGTGTLTIAGALGITGGTIVGGDSLFAMDTCTLVVNGLTTITGGTNGIASISASTGTLDFNAGITFATTLAQARITTSGAANIYFTGTMTGLGILSGINSATNIYTQSITTINAGYTFPNLTVSTGTTTTGAAVVVSNGLTVSDGATLSLGNFAFTSSGTTTVGGGTSGIISVAGAGSTGTLAFTGAVDVNAGGTFNLSTGTHVTSFGAGITMDGTTFNTGAGASTLIGNLAGSTDITFGSTLGISSGTTTNNNTGIVTSAGTLTLTGAWTQGASSTLSLGSATPFAGGGTFTASNTTPDNRVIYSAASPAIKVVAYDDLTLSGSGTATGAVTSVGGDLLLSGTVSWAQDAITTTMTNVTMNSTGTLSLGAIMTTSGLLSISQGVLDTTSVSHYNINTNNISISGTGILLGRAATITLTGNWSNSGTFTPGSSTVLMTGGNTATVSGTTTFNNFTINNPAGTKEVDFQTAGSPVFHVTGIFTVTGQLGSLITLRSDVTPTKWTIDPTGTANATYVDVMDGGCFSGAVSISTSNLINSGNNDACWLPTSITLTYSNDNLSIGFGALSSSYVRYATNDTFGSLVDTVAHSFNISTNALSGYTLTYFGNTLTSGSGTIDPAINIGTGGSSNQSQFAISGTMTSSDTGSMFSDYDHSTPQWSFVNNSTTELAHSTGPVTSDNIDMHYEANISDITPAGDYSTYITYIVTGNF